MPETGHVLYFFKSIYPFSLVIVFVFLVGLEVKGVLFETFEWSYFNRIRGFILLSDGVIHSTIRAFA